MEFDKYAKFGDYHWREFGKPSIYRSHALRVKSWISEKTGLDIGCGDGLITHLLGNGWVGVDSDKIAVKLAQKHGVRATCGSVYDLSGTYEAAYFGDVMEHLERPDMALAAISKVTSVVYLVTPPRRENLRPYHVHEWTQLELFAYMRDHGWILSDPIVTDNDRMYGKFFKT